MAAPTPIHSFALRGVFTADPHHMPPAPSGAQALIVRDRTGRVIACSWVVAEHADDQLHALAWEHLDTRDPLTRARVLTLVPSDEGPGSDRRPARSDP